MATAPLVFMRGHGRFVFVLLVVALAGGACEKDRKARRSAPDMPLGARVLPIYAGERPPIQVAASLDDVLVATLPEGGVRPPDPFALPEPQDAVTGLRPSRAADTLRFALEEGIADAH